MLPDDSDLLRRGLNVLQEKLALLAVASNHEPAHGLTVQWDKLDGFKRSGSKLTSYVIKRHAFDGLFVSKHQQNLVENWLLNSGRLTKAISKGRASSDIVPKEQHIWPDNERRRSLEIVADGRVGTFNVLS